MPVFHSIEDVSNHVNKDKQCYLLYTDGSCKAKTGQGGWGWILKKQYGTHLEIIDKGCGGAVDTTISRMEMTAILMGLLAFVEGKYTGELYIISDSQFIVNSFNKGWFKRWKETEFLGRPNADLWSIFSDTLSLIHSLHFIHTRGHEKGMEYHKEGNTEVDALCSYKNFLQ